jgi:hypothetical protein
MGFEAHPNEYEKRYDEYGVFYIRKPEYRAEQEAKLTQVPADEAEAQAEAVRRKRAQRRTDPMDSVEHEYAVRKAVQYAHYLQEAADQAEQLTQEAGILSWTGKPTGQP